MRPIILYSNRQLQDVTDEVLHALQSANSPPVLFVRGGELVRVVIDEERRPVIDAIGEHELRSRIAAVSDSFRINRRSQYTDCYPVRDVVRNILALGEWPFPPLQAVVEVPVLRPDGTILTTPGYDAPTRLIYAPADDLDVPDIPNEPGKLDVAASVDLVNEMIGDFPFFDDAGRANTLALLLTPILRPAIKGNTPLALIDAPQMGNGKGLLAQVVSIIATGRDGAMMPAATEEDEWRKRITATLRSGTSVITLDNLEDELKSPALASALTASLWTDRILGVSENGTFPVRVTWMATGNNIRLGGDIARRCYSIRLDAKTSRPWKRTGFKHPDLLAWVSEHRGEVLGALLTLARAWFAAGKPRFEVPVMGGFDEWARTVGGVLALAGVGGFLGDLDSLYESADESAGQWEHFLEALRSVFGDEPFTVKTMLNRMYAGSLIHEVLPDEMVFGRDGTSNIQRRLGHAFSKREGRRYGDANLHLQRAGTESRAIKWRVAQG